MVVSRRRRKCASPSFLPPRGLGTLASGGGGARKGAPERPAGGGGGPRLKRAARAALGVVGVDPKRGTNLWLNWRNIPAEAGIKVPISSADAGVTLPEKPPQSHT